MPTLNLSLENKSSGNSSKKSSLATKDEKTSSDHDSSDEEEKESHNSTKEDSNTKSESDDSSESDDKSIEASHDSTSKGESKAVSISIKNKKELSGKGSDLRKLGQSQIAEAKKISVYREEITKEEKTLTELKEKYTKYEK